MIKILELFGGIGSPRCALRNIGIPVKATCNGYSCKEPYQRAYDYAMSKVAAGCMVVKIE